MISLSILIPFFAGLIILILKEESTESAGKRNALITILATLISFVSAIAMQRRFFSNYGEGQLREVLWTSTGSGLNFVFAVDGLSQPLFLTTAFLFVIAAFFAWSTFRLQAETNTMPVNRRLFWSMLLFLEALVLAVFSAWNFITFFIFWELFLIPIVVLLWYYGLAGKASMPDGGNKRAALQFFLYTFISSAFMIVAFASIIYYSPRIGVDFDLRTTFASQTQHIPADKQKLMFLFFMLAFLTKMPVFPLHAWLPLTHTQAPVGTLLLSGLFLKLGSYGVLRFVTPNFPGVIAEWGTVFILLGVFSMIYGAIAAYRQKSFRYVIAYSSLAHMGLVAAGAVTWNENALTGVVIQNVGHSLANALLFIVPCMHLARGKSDDLTEIRPPQSFLYWAAFSLALFSAIGVPGTIGFVGEFLILFGFSSKSWPITLLAIFTLVFSAAYMLRLFHKVRAQTPDTSWRPNTIERFCMLALMAVILWFGLAPSSMAEAARSTVKVIIAPVNPGGSQP